MNKLTIILLAIAIVLPTGAAYAATIPNYISDPEKFFVYNSMAGSATKDTCGKSGFIEPHLCYTLVAFGYEKKTRAAAKAGDEEQANEFLRNAGSAAAKAVKAAQGHGPAANINPRLAREAALEAVRLYAIDTSRNPARAAVNFERVAKKTVFLVKTASDAVKDGKSCNISKDVIRILADVSSDVFSKINGLPSKVMQSNVTGGGTLGELIPKLQTQTTSHIKRGIAQYAVTCKDVKRTTEDFDKAYKKKCEAAGGKINSSGNCFRTPSNPASPKGGITVPTPRPTTDTNGSGTGFTNPLSGLSLPKLDPATLKGIASGIGNMFKSGSGGKSSGKSGGDSKTTKPSAPEKKAPPQPKCLIFTTENQRIKPGESATLKYAMSFSEYAAISPGVGQVHPLGGTVKVSPSESTDYTLRAQSRYGTVVCPSVHIAVLPGDDTGDQVGEQPMVSCTPSRVAKGASGLVLWQCPEGSTKSVGASTEYPKFDTANKASGSVRVKPTVTSKFVIRCRDKDNKEIGRNSCSINVGGAAVADGEPTTPGTSVRSELVVNKTNVSGGDTVTISWQGYGTTNCTITGPDDFKEHGNKGSVTGRMLQTSTFELSCTAGQAALPVKSVTINVN